MTRHKTASFLSLHVLSMWSKAQFDKFEEAGLILALVVPCWILMIVLIIALAWLT